MFINIAADLVVAAMVAAIIFAIALLMWVTWRLTVRAVSRIRPAQRAARRQDVAPPGPRRIS